MSLGKSRAGLAGRIRALGVAAAGRRAFSLLELVVVVGILGIFAAFALRALLRDIDFRRARDERATLRTYGSALDRAIMHHAYLPDASNWAAMIAAEAGTDTAVVARNPYGRDRVLLFEKGEFFGDGVSFPGVGLPYTQTHLGTTIDPRSARIIIASSLGAVLPVSSGQLDAQVFDQLWKTAPGTSPWGGLDGGDLMLERIDLSHRFIRTYLVGGQGQVSIGTNTSLYPAPGIPARYYFEGTPIRLYQSVANGSGLETSHILIRNASFLYTEGMWRSSAGGGYMPGGLDISGAVLSFLSAPPNLNPNVPSGITQQKVIVESFMAYMRAYMDWADGNFVDPTKKAYLLDVVHPNMMLAVQGIFLKDAANKDCYPVNARPCE